MSFLSISPRSALRLGWYSHPRRRRLVLCVIACTLLTAIHRAAIASESGEPPISSARRIVVLLLPGVSLDDLMRPELSHLPQMANHSAGAWVSVWRRAVDLGGLGGQVTPILRRDPARPYGVTADIEATTTHLTAILRHEGLAQIDLGDTRRAAQYAPLCAPEKALEHRLAALRSADRLVGRVMRDPTVTDLWLLAPPVVARRGLALFLWWHSGAPPGLLHSGSTHMRGVVTGSDLMATLARNRGRPLMRDGSVLEVAPGPTPGPNVSASRRGEVSALAALKRLGARSAAAERVRALAYRPVQWLLLALIGAALAALLLGRRLPELLCLVPMIVPALLLADGALRGERRLLAAVLLLMLLLAALVVRRSVPPGPSRRLPPWQAFAAVAATACGLALLAGDCLRWAVLGHSIDLGVRFYGIGNEYMGWWVGAALLALGPGEPERTRPARLLIFLTLALLIGHPGAGANLGGGITALGLIGVEAWPLLRRYPLWSAALLAGALLMIFALVVWDAARPPAAQTHLGRLAVRVAQEGLQPLFTTAAGKLSTNLRVSSGLWGVLAVAGMLVILVARRTLPTAAATRAAAGLLPAALIAFLVNDSGVIAAALMLSYGVIAAGSEGKPGHAVRRPTHSGQGQSRRRYS